MTSLNCNYIIVQAFLTAKNSLSGDFLTRGMVRRTLGANPKYFPLNFLFK